MLAASIKISNIDYEKSFQGMFPMIKENIGAVESKNLIIRLFQRLGDSALPVLTGIMYRLPESTKDELLALGLNVYGSKFREKLNQELAKDEWGKYFQVGSLWITRQEQDFFLQITQIKCDYPAFLNKNKTDEKSGILTGVVKGLTGLAFAYAPDMLEQKGLEFLVKSNNKQKLMTIAKSVLDKYGISVDLEDIQISQDTATDIVEEDVNFILTEKMESDMIDALAGYLKDKTAEEIL